MCRKLKNYGSTVFMLVLSKTNYLILRMSTFFPVLLGHLVFELYESIFNRLLPYQHMEVVKNAKGKCYVECSEYHWDCFFHSRLLYLSLRSMWRKTIVHGTQSCIRLSQQKAVPTTHHDTNFRTQTPSMKSLAMEKIVKER